jgi:hypothetical protein
MFIFIQHTHAYIIVLEYQKEGMPIFIHLLVGHSCLYSYNTHTHRVTIINNEHNNMYLVRLCRYSYTYQWVTHVRIHIYSSSNNCGVIRSQHSQYINAFDTHILMHSIRTHFGYNSCYLLYCMQDYIHA